MKNKKLLLAVFSFFLTAILFNFSILAQTSNDSDSTKIKRFEVGGQFTLLRRSDVDVSKEIFSLNGFGPRNYKSAKLNEFGVGGRLTFNFTKNIAVESEANFFRKLENPPPALGVGTSVNEPGGRKFQVVLGPKIGVRKEKFGVFGKIRPGIIQIEKYNINDQVGLPDDFFVILNREKVTLFNVDVGGVFEYYPSRRTILRVDVGDTIIRYSSFPPKNINPSFTRHNLQTSVGFGFRF